MYAQQFQPYPVAVQPQTPAPSQIDFSQLSNVIDLVDKLRGNQSAGNAQPGTTGTAGMSVGSMFQTRPVQDLAMQEMLLKNPALLQQFQQQTQQQQQQTGGLTLNQQQTEQLKQTFQAVVNCANQHYEQLRQSWQFMGAIMNAYNAMCAYAAELENAYSLGQAANIHANAFLQERDAAYQMLDVMHQMIQDPAYLVNHSFQTWDQNIGHNIGTLDLIAEYYVQLDKNTQERYRQATGNYHPKYQEYLQSQINNQAPLPQIQQQPQNQQGGNNLAMIQTLSQAINGNGNGQLGKGLQKLHNQRMGWG